MIYKKKMQWRNKEAEQWRKVKKKKDSGIEKGEGGRKRIRSDSSRMKKKIKRRRRR